MNDDEDVVDVHKTTPVSSPPSPHSAFWWIVIQNSCFRLRMLCSAKCIVCSGGSSSSWTSTTQLNTYSCPLGVRARFSSQNCCKPCLNKLETWPKLFHLPEVNIYDAQCNKICIDVYIRWLFQIKPTFRKQKERRAEVNWIATIELETAGHHKLSSLKDVHRFSFSDQ